MRAKIIAWSFFPTAIILIAVAWVTFAAYQRVTEDLVIERNQELTRLSTGEFAAGLAEYTGLLTGYTGLLADLARTAYVYENDPAAQQGALRRARDRLQVFDGGVLIINSRGTVVAAEPERTETVGQNWSNRSYFRQMLRSPEPVFSDIVADGPAGAEVIVVAVPIEGNQGQFLGLMAGMFRAGADTHNPFYHDIAMLRIGESENTFLVDGQGRVIYHSDADRIAEDFSRQRVVQQVTNERVGALRTRDLEGRDIVASFAPVPGTSWGLVTEEGWDKLISPSQGYRRFLLVLLALGVLVPAAVVAVGVKRITEPIIELIGAAQEVAGGNFGQTITAHTGDEVEELAEQFNLMAAKLQASYARLEQRVEDRTKELAALNAIASSVSGSLALEEMLCDSLDKTLQVMEVEAGGIYLLDDETRTLNITTRRGFGPELAQEIDRLQVGEGFSGRVAQTGAPLVVKDVSSDPRLTRLAVKKEGLRCLASVPLHAKGKVLGTLFTVTRSHREFTEQDVQLLTSIGHQIGIAVENARLFAQIEQRMQELEALFRAGAGLHRNLQLEEVLQALVDIAVDILQADKSSVWVWDAERERLVIKVARGFDAQTLTQLTFTSGQGITGRVILTGEPVIVEDSLNDPWRKGEQAQVLRVIDAEGIRSFMHLPIQINSEIFGVFNINFTRPHAFGSHEQRLFLALAQRAALAVENARLLDAERRQRQEATLLAEMAKLISGTLDLDEVLQLTAKYAVDVFDVHCCSILLFDEKRGTLRPATQIGFSDPTAATICDAEFSPSESMRQTVFEALQPLIVEDATSNPHLSPREPFDLQSVLVVPIEVGGRRLGAMQLGTQRPKRHQFTTDEGELALAMANHAAVAIENARLFKAERRRAEQFRVISEVGRRITSTLVVEELLDQMARLIQKIFHYDLVSFGLIEGDTVLFEVGVGPVWNTNQSLRLRVGQEGIGGWVAQTGEPLLVPDVRNEPRYYSIPQAAATRSELCVPLKTKDAVIGVLDVQSHQLYAFDEIDLAVLQSLADQTAVAIESARLFRDATRQVRELRALADASRIISSMLDQDKLLQALYEQITRIAPTDFYAIALYDEYAWTTACITPRISTCWIEGCSS